MSITTQHARIIGPVSYTAGSGKMQHIPIGPCLVERLQGRCIDIIWGARGQRSAALPIEQMQAAQDCGNLLLLD